MEDCVFCKIAKGEIPAAKTYEDDDILAVMTVEAINPGHLLVVPKKHVRYFYNADDDTYQKVMDVVKKMAIAVEKTFKPKRVSLMTMGDEIPHLHVHVVPVNDVGDVNSKKLIDGTALHPELGEREAWSQKIRANLG